MTSPKNPDKPQINNDYPVAVDFKDEMLCVTLADGRMIATPLNWYPRLVNASEQQLNDFEISSDGVHWAELDEDLSIRGMLQGNRPRAFSVRA